MRAEIRRTKLEPPTITLTIHNAKDLPKMDLFGKPDPYVVVSFGESQLQSERKKNTKNPVWEFVNTFTLVDQTPIVVTLFDKDKFTKDDKIDEFKLEVADIIRQGNVEKVCVKLKKKGEVYYSIGGLGSDHEYNSGTHRSPDTAIDLPSPSDLPELEKVEVIVNTTRTEMAEAKEHIFQLEAPDSVLQTEEHGLSDDWEMVDESLLGVNVDFTSKTGFAMSLPSQEDDPTSMEGQGFNVSKSPSPVPISMGEAKLQSLTIDRPDDISAVEIGRSSATKTMFVRKVSKISINLGTGSQSEEGNQSDGTVEGNQSEGTVE